MRTNDEQCYVKSVKIFSKILELHIDGPIAVLTLNDPSRKNALSLEMMDALWQARQEIDSHVGLRVVIVTGRGDAFSGGGNVRDMVDRKGLFASEDPGWARDINIRCVHQISKAVYGISVPTIAAVNGYAIGGGCDLALMCDIRIAAESAVFSESFLAAGLVPGDGGAWFLSRVVGLSRAMELTLTCDLVDAATAERIGLVSRVVPDAQLMPEAIAFAERIASKAPNVAKMTKRLVRFGAESSLSETLEMTAAMQAIAQTSEEHRDAARRLVERLKDNR